MWSARSLVSHRRRIGTWRKVKFFGAFQANANTMHTNRVWMDAEEGIGGPCSELPLGVSVHCSTGASTVSAAMQFIIIRRTVALHATS